MCDNVCKRHRVPIILLLRGYLGYHPDQGKVALRGVEHGSVHGPKYTSIWLLAHFGQAIDSRFLVARSLATVRVSVFCSVKLLLMEKFDGLGFMTGSGAK